MSKKKRDDALQPIKNDEVKALADTPFGVMFREALSDVERDLALEDAGWMTSSASASNTIVSSERISIINRARQCYHYYALAKQGVRLWVNYTFGTGIDWTITDTTIKESEEKSPTENAASDLIESIWSSEQNASVFSTQGQHKSARKLLVDGELFFALFIGAGETTVRRIDPLEITELLCNPDDSEDVLLFKREWTDGSGKQRTEYYPSITNRKKESCRDQNNIERSADKKAPLVYHMKFDELGDRGLSLLTPILDWLKLYRRFMASRVAIMLALARFAWKAKVKGGAAAVAAEKGKYDGQMYQAGSVRIENEGVDLQPVRTDTAAGSASEDGRQLKLLIANGFGIPEQYFCDISTGNLATAQTVELPMLKQFQAHQQLWSDAFKTIFEVILEGNNIDTENLSIDIDFPAIAPEDSVAAVQAIMNAITAFPQFAGAEELQKKALINLGLNNTDEILEALAQVEAEPSIQKALEQIAALKNKVGATAGV